MDAEERLAELARDPMALIAFIEENHPDLLEDDEEESAPNRVTRRWLSRQERRRRHGPKR